MTEASRHARAACLLALLVALAVPAPASAKILKTRRPVKTGEPHELLLTIGSGFEYETDSEQSEYGYPFLVEYGFTNRLKLTVEESYISLQSKSGGSVSGLGDLETALAYEFVAERRYRPSIALEGLVKWPTASQPEIGTGQTDYSIGAIVSKDFITFDTDFNALYTFVGSPPGFQLPNTFELSLAAEWHVTRTLDIEAEYVTSFGSGGIRGQPGTLSGFGGVPGSIASAQLGAESEAALGFAKHLNDCLKIEAGGILKFDGSWQTVLSWEWDFAGGR